MKFILLVLSALFVGHFALLAQLQNSDTCSDYYYRLYQTVQEIYGIDQVLVNGIIHEDMYPNKIGHPFLYENEFYKGTVTFRGKEYTGTDLKYDVFEQQLVLNVNYNHSSTWVILPNDFISDFTLNGKYFAKLSYQEEPRFYQVIFDTDKLKCLYYHSKSKFNADQKGISNQVEFKIQKIKRYLVMNSELIKYNNNRSFTRQFPKEFNTQITSYLKSKRINVAQAGDDKVSELIAYCNALLNP
ncbi:MAG: hypothetical protein JW915_11955 [Chitinispirillaceae bacterium]|nr:hypothetical protein [Chitinispirillaceae bacterium]